MSLKSEVKEILSMIKNTDTSKRMPDSAVFLNDSMVLNFPREDGDSRYPLEYDGFTIWTHSSGYINGREGRLYTLGCGIEGDEPDIDFFAGIPLKNGKYKQISLLGLPKKNDDTSERYCVFTPYATYYFTIYEGYTFCVRVFVNKSKEAVFSVYCSNDTDDTRDILLSSYISPLICRTAIKNYGLRWQKNAKIIKSDINNQDTAIFRYKDEVYAVVKGSTTKTPKTYYRTTARLDYTGGKSRSISESRSIFNGCFEGNISTIQGVDDGVYGDIKIISLVAGESIRSDMLFSCYANPVSDEILNRKVDCVEIDNECAVIKKEKEELDNVLKINFDKATDDYLDNEIFNSFISFVKRQTHFSAFTKVYGWSDQLGLRDIWQQSEPALIWAKKDFEKMAINALSIVEDNGRVPRQYGPAVLNYPICFDLDKKPDQGMWAISTLYTYLSVTNDFDFLNKTCSFYKYPENDSNKAYVAEKSETVLEHICRMAEYLISIIAKDTGCVRVLLGDWNDALIGLGTSIDGLNEFGSGVSIMATIQVYNNLGEVAEILEKVDSEKYEERIQKFKDTRKSLLESLLKNAIVENEKGEKRIVHGWGDKQSFYVGSFCDGDGKARVSSIDHSFWLISNLLQKTPELHEMIVNNLRKTDSKYGVRTFDEKFTTDFKQLKNITTMLPGTLENAATYIHNAMFAVLGLMRSADYDFAFEQLKKLLPFTHERLSHSAFVMSNSYLYNEECGIDGESASDWQTGSAPVLLKIIINQICGFNPSFDGLTISPCGKLPFTGFTFELNNERFDISVKYVKNDLKRKFYVNGMEYKSIFDNNLNVEKIFISNEELKKLGKIEILIEG